LQDHRPDLRDAFNTFSISGLQEFILWWKTNGPETYPLINQIFLNKSLSLEFILLASQCEINIGDKIISVPVFIKFMMNERPEIFEAYDISSCNGLIGFLDWWQNFGSKDYPSLYALVKCPHIEVRYSE
jgi:hypothetical protein